MEELLKQIISKLNSMELDLKEVKTNLKEVKSSVNQIETSVLRLEESQPADIISILHNINDKVSSIDNRLDYQLGKIAKNEEELYLLKQKQ
jgi:archaellum component FlaC